MAGHVDVVPVGVPAAHRLDRARIGRAGEDALVAVALLDADLQLLGLAGG